MRLGGVWESVLPRRWSADQKLTFDRSGRRVCPWQEICRRYALIAATVGSAALPGEVDEWSKRR
jgi:hypothetical protein